MTEFADFLMTALALFVFAFIVVGAVGGWIVCFALMAREDELARQANRHAREDIVRANPINPLDVRA